MSLVLVTMLGLTVYADGKIDAPIEDVRAALVDYAAHRQVLGAIAESEVLERTTQDLYVHQRFRVPLLQDREATLHVAWQDSGLGASIRFEVVDDSRRLAPAGAAVRVTRYSGIWQLDPIAEGAATRVRFAVDLDFGGTLPQAIVRLAFARELPRLYDGLRRLSIEERTTRLTAQCPSAVVGASTEVADAPDGVRVIVTAADPAARLEIRRRATAYAERRQLGILDPDDQVTACPGFVPQTIVDATDVTAGVALMVRPFDPSRLELLRSAVLGRGVAVER